MVIIIKISLQIQVFFNTIDWFLKKGYRFRYVSFNNMVPASHECKALCIAFSYFDSLSFLVRSQNCKCAHSFCIINNKIILVSILTHGEYDFLFVYFIFKFIFIFSWFLTYLQNLALSNSYQNYTFYAFFFAIFIFPFSLSFKGIFIL